MATNMASIKDMNGGKAAALIRPEFPDTTSVIPIQEVRSVSLRIYSRTADQEFSAGITTLALSAWEDRGNPPQWGNYSWSNFGEGWHNESGSLNPTVKAAGSKLKDLIALRRDGFVLNRSSGVVFHVGNPETMELINKHLETDIAVLGKEAPALLDALSQ